MCLTDRRDAGPASLRHLATGFPVPTTLDTTLDRRHLPAGALLFLFRGPRGCPPTSWWGGRLEIFLTRPEGDLILALSRPRRDRRRDGHPRRERAVGLGPSAGGQRIDRHHRAAGRPPHRRDRSHPAHVSRGGDRALPRDRVDAAADAGRFAFGTGRDEAGPDRGLRSGFADPGPGAGDPRRPGAVGVQTVLPAHRPPRFPSARRLRGTHALAPSAARPSVPGRLHPGRRKLRPHRRAYELGDGGGRPRLPGDHAGGPERPAQDRGAAVHERQHLRPRLGCRLVPADDRGDRRTERASRPAA